MEDYCGYAFTVLFKKGYKDCIVTEVPNDLHFWERGLYIGTPDDEIILFKKKVSQAWHCFSAFRWFSFRGRAVHIALQNSEICSTNKQAANSTSE
jgi:hypothetical protein